MKEEEFIQLEIIDALEEIKTHKSILIKLLLSAHMIETLGAFADKKPFACPQQSRKRFDASIALFFSDKYHKVNQKSFFYNKFRSNLVHYYQLHKIYRITNLKEKHLCWENESILIEPEQLLTDVQNAAKQVISLFQKNQLKRKKVGSLTSDFGGN